MPTTQNIVFDTGRTVSNEEGKGKKVCGTQISIKKMPNTEKHPHSCCRPAPPSEKKYPSPTKGVSASTTSKKKKNNWSQVKFCLNSITYLPQIRFLTDELL